MPPSRVSVARDATAAAAAGLSVRAGEHLGKFLHNGGGTSSAAPPSCGQKSERRRAPRRPVRRFSPLAPPSRPSVSPPSSALECINALHFSRRSLLGGGRRRPQRRHHHHCAGAAAERERERERQLCEISSSLSLLSLRSSHGFFEQCLVRQWMAWMLSEEGLSLGKNTSFQVMHIEFSINVSGKCCHAFLGYLHTSVIEVKHCPPKDCSKTTCSRH